MDQNGAATFKSGAVFLYSFSSSNVLTGGTLQAVIGNEMEATGNQKNLGMPGLLGKDWFGQSVSLQGGRLAVGANGDDGASEVIVVPAGGGDFQVGEVIQCDGCTGTATGTITSIDALADSFTAISFTFDDDYATGTQFQASQTVTGSVSGTSKTISSVTSTNHANGQVVGAVHLFSFNDDVSAFPSSSGITHEASIGNGFVCDKCINLTSTSVSYTHLTLPTILLV